MQSKVMGPAVTWVSQTHVYRNKDEKYVYHFRINY